MRPSKRQAARESMEARKAYRAESARKAAQEAAEREAKIRASLTRDARSEALRPTVLDLYGSTIYKRAPRLWASPTYGPIVRGFQGDGHLRPIQDWEPRGKGGETLFRSLCDHLWAAYPMPSFLWTAFVEPNKPTWLEPMVKDVARGGSLFAHSKEGRFPVKLTRAQVHELMTKTPGDTSFIRAVRRVQVKTVGGTPRLYQVWTNTTPGKTLDSPTRESFWSGVILWFAQNPMFDPSQIGPMVDYLGYRINQDPTFSMKGRSPLALMRAMQEWHGELAKLKAVKGGRKFAPSGFRDHEVENSVREKSGNHIRAIWRIKELLSDKELIEEGKDLRHCVASYSWRVEAGTVSIWSMTFEDNLNPEQRVCTIEVVNGSRTIVQARGKFNKMIESQPFRVMQQWAGLNGLTIGNLGTW